MAVKPIVLYKEAPGILRKHSEAVKDFEAEAKDLIQDLKDTLNTHGNGIGLAAPQIGVHKRAIVVREGAGVEGAEPDPPRAIVNPEILHAEDPRRDFDGCLSFPGLFGRTVRPHTIHLKGLDEEGRPFERRFEGFDAVVVHHEIDHLDGVLFIDRAESTADLYIVEVDEEGQQVRVPLPEVISRHDVSSLEGSLGGSQGGPAL